MYFSPDLGHYRRNQKKPFFDTDQNLPDLGCCPNCTPAPLCPRPVCGPVPQREPREIATVCESQKTGFPRIIFFELLIPQAGVVNASVSLRTQRSGKNFLTVEEVPLSVSCRLWSDGSGDIPLPQGARFLATYQGKVSYALQCADPFCEGGSIPLNFQWIGNLGSLRNNSRIQLIIAT